MPVLPRPRIYPRHQVHLPASALAALARTLGSGEIVRGPSLERLEAAFAARHGVAGALGLASGRTGLLLALDALGLKEGDEVLIPDFTLAAMPGLLLARGLVPVFVDVDPRTWHLDPSRLEAAIGPRARAVVATHLFGLASDMPAILDIARARGLFVIEDCAQSCGTRLEGGPVGAFGDLALFSFNTGKNMAAFGGGMLLAREPALWERIRGRADALVDPDPSALLRQVLRVLAVHGVTSRTLFPATLYAALRLADLMGSRALDQAMFEPTALPTLPSRHARLSELQARVALTQLDALDAVNARTRVHAEILAGALAEVEGIDFPRPIPGSTPCWSWFKIEVDDRDALRAWLLPRGVDTNEDDMSACSTLDTFRSVARDCPVSARIHRRSMEIPNGYRMSAGDARFVAGRVREGVEALRR
jgi:dTDP-4-amino-4,6-dideoxygalactose transaminase